MQTARISLHQAIALASSGMIEPQSGHFLNARDVVNLDSLIRWATKAFPIVIMIAKSDFDDQIEISYFRD